MRGLVGLVSLVVVLVVISGPMVTAAPPATRQERGKVSAVKPDPKNAKVTLITVSSHGHDLATLKADADTKVTVKGGEAAKLTDVVVGTNVTIVVTPFDGDQAVSIEINPPKK